MSHSDYFYINPKNEARNRLIATFKRLGIAKEKTIKILNNFVEPSVFFISPKTFKRLKSVLDTDNKRTDTDN